ncbi:MAG: DUF169 domain-containing protein [Candidatus Helarchaeota archaeon]
MTQGFEEYLHVIQSLFQENLFLPVCIRLLKETPPDAVIEERFCSAVLKASKGAKLVVKDFSECLTPVTMLGLEQPKYTDHPFRIKPATTKALKLAPLGKMDDFDIILFIVNPRQAMDLGLAVQMLTGKGVETSFSGTSALCGEATSRVIMTNKPHVSFLCNGARLFVNFPDEYLVIGIPKSYLDGIIEKLKKIDESRASIRKKLLKRSKNR